jgi:signal transduction histidine kinase
VRRLVDDLLTLEREHAAADPGDRDSLAVRVELEELARAAAAENPRVRLIRAERSEVRGDPRELRRALDKLVENALVHGPPEGDVRISVEPRNGRVRLAVTDAGPGPDPSDRERIFERFARGPDAAARPGSGLGLAIADAIVRRHGGRIEVDHATFTIDLPAA